MVPILYWDRKYGYELGSAEYEYAGRGNAVVGALAEGFLACGKMAFEVCGEASYLEAFCCSPARFEHNAGLVKAEPFAKALYCVFRQNDLIGKGHLSCPSAFWGALNGK
jgi:hypothetical protein